MEHNNLGLTLKPDSEFEFSLPIYLILEKLFKLSGSLFLHLNKK